MMNCRLIVVLLVLLSCASSALAERRYIVRSTTGSVLQSVCRLLGCSVVRGLSDPGSQLFLVSTPDLLDPVLFLFGLTRQTGILGVEVDAPVNIVPPIAFSTNLPVPSGLLDERPVQCGADTVWNGYASQPAAQKIRAPDAQSTFRVNGNGAIVAVIDTGVDPQHPALRSVVMSGYDFTLNQLGGSEKAGVNQSTAAVVDGTPMSVNNSTIAVVDQSTAAVVDEPGNAAFGHGTMVAGIIHLVAPRALIMPLRAFRSDGLGYTSDIVRAIYWATQYGARAINMSFSVTSSSKELKTALDFAVGRQLICVGSAGNSGRRTSVYPAAWDNTIGVGSTDLADRRSSFSNYGSSLVWVAAPGEAIVSTYPYGTYAAGWGTSFSTAFVSGAAALLLDLQPATDHWKAARALANAKPLGADMGYGRLDVYLALRALRNR